MKLLIARLALASLFVVPALLASEKYQVTGNVVAVDGTNITLLKSGKEKFEIALGSATVPAGVKVGSKVTVYYSMTANTIESKDKAAAPAKPVKAAKTPAAKS
jgi:riboflavin synthase alpha subunit